MTATPAPDDGFAEQGLSDFLLTVDDLETMVRAGVLGQRVLKSARASSLVVEGDHDGAVSPLFAPQISIPLSELF